MPHTARRPKQELGSSTSESSQPCRTPVCWRSYPWQLWTATPPTVSAKRVLQSLGVLLALVGPWLLQVLAETRKQDIWDSSNENQIDGFSLATLKSNESKYLLMKSNTDALPG